MIAARSTTLPRLLLTGLAVLLISGCTMGGGGGGLAPGLTARLDSPGASIDRVEALNLINHYRSTTGAGMLVADAGLDSSAQGLAVQYAKTGTPPGKPAGSTGIRYSAGYYDFAETFSGWRNSPADAAVLRQSAGRAGLGAVYDPKSSYGVYWVLVLAN